MTTINNASNRLAKEKSPYLLQHTYNPADWFPWGVDREVMTWASGKGMLIFRLFTCSLRLII